LLKRGNSQERGKGDYGEQQLRVEVSPFAGTHTHAHTPWRRSRYIFNPASLLQSSLHKT